MGTALFAFESPDAARLAAQTLRKQGVPNDAMRLHVRSADDSVAAAVDEQATGGLVSNVIGLFGEIFEWGSLPIDASPYAAAVRRGCAVLSVDSDSEVTRAGIDEAITDAGPTIRSEWFDC